MGAEACKESGEDGSDKEVGGVEHDSRNAGYGKRHENLADVMSQCAEYRYDIESMIFE